MNWQTTLDQLERGEVRAATRNEQGIWEANQDVKRAILAAFKAGVNSAFSGSYEGFVDKANLPPRQFTIQDNVRLVPGGSSVRRGAYVAPGVIIMPPAYINIGAFVDEGCMIDSHALVGSCAQVGKNVHVSAGVQIGGVLEPIGANPVVIEDGAFIGAGAVLVEGVVVGARAVIAPGVSLSAAVSIYDCVNQTVLPKGSPIPADAVVVPGTRPMNTAWGKTLGLSISCPMIVKYRDEKSNAALELEEVLR
jgi:2,3,4,5-tetrahydropyridine-2-carboxylate N-succinyltransferase